MGLEREIGAGEGGRSWRGEIWQVPGEGGGYAVQLSALQCRALQYSAMQSRAVQCIVKHCGSIGGCGPGVQQLAGRAGEQGSAGQGSAGQGSAEGEGWR